MGTAIADAARLGDIRHFVGDHPKSLPASLTLMMSGIARKAWIEEVIQERGPSGLLYVRLQGGIQ